MFEKDVVVPGRMRRKIANPRILLLDCPLEYKKGENQTNVELAKEEDWYEGAGSCAAAGQHGAGRGGSGDCRGSFSASLWLLPPFVPPSFGLPTVPFVPANPTHTGPPPPPSPFLIHRAALLKLEEDWVARTCAQIAALKPDLVITEKGLSDLAAHYLTKAGISAIRRLRKTDNNRIARAAGATIVSRPDEATERDIGTGAGLFEVRKIGDEFWTFIVDCEVCWCLSSVLGWRRVRFGVKESDHGLAATQAQSFG